MNHILPRGHAGAQELPVAEAANDAPATWLRAADALLTAGHVIPALAAVGRAHRLDPQDLQIAMRRADLAWLAGTTEAELIRLDAFAADHPAVAAPLAGRALLLARAGRDREAAEVLEAACLLDPVEPRLWALLGSVLFRDHQLARAEQALANALKLDPENDGIRHDRAVVLFRMYRFAEAHAELLAVRERRGDDPSLLANLANATLCLGLQEAALRVAEDGLALAPDGLLAHRTLVNTLPYRPGITGREMLGALRACGAALPRAAEPASFAVTADAGRRLRVGLLGGLLKTHPVGWLTLAGFENLDPHGFELVGISSRFPQDALARRFEAACRDWIDPSGKDDRSLAQAIRAAKVDVLIDLGGYGDSGRIGVCAYRPAPVQVKWVGMQNHSTGLPEMDWLITDRWETPPELAASYSERLLTMPDGYICYTAPPNAPPVGPLPALGRGGVTFGSFCNLAKVNPEVIATWSRVLHRVAGARLILRSHPLGSPEIAARIRSSFAAHGIGGDQLVLRGACSHRAFLQAWNEVDIALDTFPYSGGLTTVEALWMGVPTLTIPGETFASRHSFSHLCNLGLDDWAVPDRDLFVAAAMERASRPERLAGLRAELRERVRTSALGDAPRFGRNLGATLRHAWAEWCMRQA